MKALGVKSFKCGDLEVEFHESCFKPVITSVINKDYSTPELELAAEARAKSQLLQKKGKSVKIGGKVVDEKLLFHSSN